MEKVRPVSPQRLVRNERLKRGGGRARKDGDEEAALLDEALAALRHAFSTRTPRPDAAGPGGVRARSPSVYDGSWNYLGEVAELREKSTRPLPHARVALDYFTLYEIANWQGGQRGRARAGRRWHLKDGRAGRRRLSRTCVAAAITSNQTADLAEGMIGFSVDDGGLGGAARGRRRAGRRSSGGER